MSPNKNENRLQSAGPILGLTVGALGVVFGDIGTSPLYAMNKIFFGTAKVFSQEEILGCISLVLWTLTLMISGKYLFLVLRAESDGEGGVFAIYSRIAAIQKKYSTWIKTLLMLSAGLLFGEGMITPAISVLSAVEGFSVVTPEYGHLTIPLTVTILFFLFLFQSKGTHLVARFYGPIALVWFSSISILGVWQIFANPQVVQAINPIHAIRFIFTNDVGSVFITMGSAMLVITGGEAMFASMGHFGIKPIRLGWFAVVFPSLILSYLGQGAYMFSGSKVIEKNLFYSMIPSGLLIPMTILATLASIIASQALISGAFSLTSQAIRLGLFPRLKINHTHQDHAGQIYLRFVNWILFFGTVAFVFSFKTSQNLASAYGLSDSMVMMITSIAMFVLAMDQWHWKFWKAGAVFGSLLVVDLVFVVSNFGKFFEGGFVPLAIGFCIFSVMKIWKWGRKVTYKSYLNQPTLTIQQLIEMKKNTTECIDRNVVFMVQTPVESVEDKAPPLLQFFLNRYGLIPKNLFFVVVSHKKFPFVHHKRYESRTFFRDDEKGTVSTVTIEFGFMEEPNVESVLEDLAKHHQISLPNDPHRWVIHVSQENLIAFEEMSWFAKLQLRLFLLFRQISQPAYYYYGLGKAVNLTVEIMPVRLINRAE